MSDCVPDPRAYLDELDDLLHAFLGDDVDLNDAAAVERASNAFEARMADATQEARDEIGAILAPAAESVERVVDAAQGIADPDPTE